MDIEQFDVSSLNLDNIKHDLENSEKIHEKEPIPSQDNINGIISFN